MRKINEVARLKAAGLSIRQIARSCNVPVSTVGDYLKRLSAAAISWPLPEGVSEEELHDRLFAEPQVRERDEKRPLPQWEDIHKELRRKGVTLRLLWEEYREAHAQGYGYSQFCAYYRRWNKSLEVCMRQAHRGGEKLFVDYAGMTMPVVEAKGQGVYEAQIFVAALGASQYLYAEATRTQQLPDWVGSHIRTFEYIGGVSEITVPDNLKSGVSKACRYEPQLNRTYEDMATHYGTVIIPARPRKPKDKAKVESGVQIIEREVLAPIRDCTFFSLEELNRAIRQQLERVNQRRFQKLTCSRWDLFQELDKPALKPLPAQRYEHCDFLEPKVNIDYHIEVRGHYYSVPYELKNQKIEVRLSARMVEVLCKGKRVASHPRDSRKGRHTTNPAHMPKAHRAQLEWTPSRLINWAGQIGPHCAGCVRHILQTRPHPEQGYRACLGIMRLSKGYAAACG